MKYHLEFDVDFKRNTHRGLFIVVEGIDGAGKTTQVHDLAVALAKKYPTYETKQPTEGPIGKFIRKVLAGDIKVPPVSFQYLFSADRQSQQQEIEDRLKKGEIVVMDRYIWSALAYGIVDYGFKKFKETDNHLMIALSILSMYHQFLFPDLNIYLDIPISTSVKRLNKSGRIFSEIYKREEKMKQAKISYGWLLRQFPQEFIVVDGNRDESLITNEILSHIEPLIKK